MDYEQDAYLTALSKRVGPFATAQKKFLHLLVTLQQFFFLFQKTELILDQFLEALTFLLIPNPVCHRHKQ